MEVGRPIEGAAKALLGELAESRARASEGLEYQPLTDVALPNKVAAVDGGQSIVADMGTCGIFAIRAGSVLRHPGDKYVDSLARDAVRTVAKRHARQEWDRLVGTDPWFQGAPQPMTQAPAWVRPWAEAERTIAEFESGRRALSTLDPGDVLLWDGSLQGDPTFAEPMQKLLALAQAREVSLVGLSKDTSLTFGGSFPFTVELEEWARDAAAPARMAVDVTAALNPDANYRTWAVRWDPRSRLYRVDVSVAAGWDDASLLSALAHTCNDVAFPGYPYPLARAHQRYHFQDHEAGDMRRRLESVVAERRGTLYSLRLFGRGRDVLALGD